MKYRTIVADPPWDVPHRMGRGGRRRRATTIPYATASDAWIAALPVLDLAEDDAHLFLWSTRKRFREGIAATVARAWGFEPCGELIWGLRNWGLGSPPLMNDHEPVLIARRGDATLNQVDAPLGVYFWRQLYNGAAGKAHSAKPDGFLDLVEQVSEGPYLELFARRQRLGWDTWGDEALEHVTMDEV